MSTYEAAEVRPHLHLRSDLLALRGQVLENALRALLVLALFIFSFLVVTYREPKAQDPYAASRTLGIAAAIVVVVTFARWCRNIGGILGGALALIGCFGIVLTGAVIFTRDAQLLYFYGLLVVLTGGTLGARASLATSAISCILFLSASIFGMVPQEDATGAATLIVGIGIAVWLSLKPTYTAVEWAMTSYARARETAEELRDRQVELIRTTEKLKLANERLEHINEALARAREQADEARRLKAQFAATVSHELRTPLTHIIGFADLIMNSPENFTEPLPSEYRRSIDAICRSAHHLSRLVDDILDLSQIDAARMGLLKERIDIAIVISEATNAVAGLLSAKGLPLNISLRGEIPPVQVDRTRIRQVLINLLGNAIRFTESGNITVLARTDGDEILISVRDTGIGIKASDLPKLFDEFHQVENTSIRRHGGSGLGLAICKRFVELHHGRIWVDSKPGVGSTFTFCLPIGTGKSSTEAHSGFQVRTSSSQTSKGLMTVVVVGDDPAIPRLLERYSEGLMVLGIDSIDELNKFLTREAVDAVVLVATSTRELWPDMERLQNMLGAIPIVACSLPRQARRLKERGFSGWLTKPISADRLREQLTRIGSEVKTALIVDDDADTAYLLTNMVRSILPDCRISSATNGENALIALRGQVPDVVLLDLVMPNVDGYAVLEVMKSEKKFSSVPVVAVTGRQDPEGEIIADAIALTRGGGLAAGELIPCLSTSLSTLLKMPSATREFVGTGVS